MPAGPDDDVIEQIDFHELAGPDQVPGGSDVSFTWGRVAAGMIVHEDNRRG